jgi:hypothetical protein
MDLILVLGLLMPPLAAAFLALVARRAPARAAWFNVATMPISIVAAVAIAVRQAAGGAPVVAGEMWRIDSLSAWLAIVISAVATLAVALGPGIGREHPVPDRETRTFRIYANLFAFTMLVAVSTGNLGLMWVAIEATTVTSALLIPLHRTKASVDASWKYLLIGSVGIACEVDIGKHRSRERQRLSPIGWRQPAGSIQRWQRTSAWSDTSHAHAACRMTCGAICPQVRIGGSTLRQSSKMAVMFVHACRFVSGRRGRCCS